MIVTVVYFVFYEHHGQLPPVLDTVGWAAGRASGLSKMGDDGGEHWLVRMEWRPAGWSVCLPLLIFLCTIKSRSSLLAPAHPGGPRKKGCKTVVVVWNIMVS